MHKHVLIQHHITLHNTFVLISGFYAQYLLFLVKKTHNCISIMEVGKIQVAADEDFEKLWQMVVSDNQWKLEYQHDEIKVWSKHSNNSDVKTIKVNSI